ncbi:hypothetical protein PIB30_039280 [Stylosanthes scabra]|uniref:CCHC-type domain-containing protein n=1 Tax=Stylosanthes scabra TaxID=79078 RepID=A0ABU6XC00_9FABA|nr:hypothetical protein [Stylosanthes scabra]
MGAKTHDLFEFSLNGIGRLCAEVESKLNGATHVESNEPNTENIKDPVVVRTKGAPKKPKHNKGRKRRCSKCRRPGHTKRHCGAEMPSQGSSPSGPGLLADAITCEASRDKGDDESIAGSAKEQN